MREEAFRMEHVTTDDAGRTNLHNFHLQVYKGEMVGMICLNDRGKDKLLELLQYGGEIKFGRIYCREKMVNSHDFENARSGRVYVAGYKSHLVEDLTVAENLFVVRKGMKKYFLSRRVLREQTAQNFIRWKLQIEPEKYVKNLTAFERCALELMKAVFMDAALIVVNDVANVLSAGDLEKFHKLMFRLLEGGYSILYLGNWHEKIFYHASRTAFMQDGTIIKILDREDYDREKIKQFLAPAQLEADEEENGVETVGENILEFRSVTYGSIHALDFHIKRGECQVLWDENSRLRVDMETLFAEGNLSAGSIFYKGRKVNRSQWCRIVGKKCAIIPENPIERLLFYHMDYLDNLCFGLEEKLGGGCHYQRLRKGIAAEWGEELGDDLMVDDIRTLSKYSLYRLVYYRMLIRRPEFILCINPFADCDLYLQGQVMEWIERLKRQGIAVLVTLSRN